MWKYYKDENNQVYAYAADGSQDAFIKPELTPITAVEADELRRPPPPTIEQQIAEIHARLSEIDIASVRPLRAIVAGEATEADTARLEALTSEASALREQLATLTAATAE